MRQLEVDPGLLGGGEQVQDGVGRAPHGDVDGHGVAERVKACNRAWQYGFVILLVISLGKFHHQPSGREEQRSPVTVGREQRAITRQSDTEGFGPTIHGIGGQHAGATATCGAGTFLYLQQVVTGIRLKVD